MKDIRITEFVNFSVLETTTDAKLQSKADIFISNFLKKQQGFVDAELVKDVNSKARCFIIHYESFEKVNAIIEKMKNSREFDDFKSVILQGSIGVNFYQQAKNW